MKTFYFHRYNENNISNKYNLIKKNTFNITFYTELKGDLFRAEKLIKMGLEMKTKIGFQNLYLLPYIMNETFKNEIPRLIVNKYQKINQYLNYEEYCSKSLLYFNYKKMKELFPSSYNYMLETYSNPEDKYIITEKFYNYSIKNSLKDNLWLLKPKLSLKGIGIQFLSNFSNIKNNYIITKYLNNPHIIKGVKYDLRFHGLVTSIKPLMIYLYNEGLVRLATESFDYNNIDNKFAFLTNLHINKENKNKFIYPVNISDIENSHFWNFKTLKKFYLRKGINFNNIYNDVKDIFIKMIFSVRKKIIENIEKNHLLNSNFYHLIGFDIILDHNLKPYLLEANRKTGFRDDNDAEKDFTFNIIIDTINLVGLKLISRKKNKIISFKETIKDNICELSRPQGGYNLIFPLKNNIDKYKMFYLGDIPKEDLYLWNDLKE